MSVAVPFMSDPTASPSGPKASVMPGTAGGKIAFSMDGAIEACGSTAMNSSLARTDLLAGIWPALAHVTELSSMYLMKMPAAASLHGSMVPCVGSVNWCEPAQVAGFGPICGTAVAMPLNSTPSPVTLVVCQMPFQIMPTVPALKAFSSASTSRFGSDQFFWASSIHCIACTPASLFQVASVPSALNSLPPNWWSNCWKICCTGKPPVMSKPLLSPDVMAAAAAANSSPVVGAAVRPAALSRSAL